MEYRYLGQSGLKITEITYGNWLTHGSQVENDVATSCVRAALEVGITTFDTADAYANGAAEEVLGTALASERRESLEVFTKVYWPVGPKGANDTGLSRKHIMEGINGSLRRLNMDYVDLYQAHRYDYETPLEETIQAFADVVRAGKALYIGVSEWNAEQLRAGQALARQAGFSLVSNQPQYSALWRVIEPEVIPASIELGMSQVVWIRVCFQEQTCKALADASLGQIGYLGATTTGRVRATARHLQRMGHVEKDRVFELLHDAEAQHVDNKVVVAKAGATFAEDQLIIARFFAFAQDVFHLLRCEELGLLDVDHGAGLGHSHDQVSLTRQERRQLDDVADFGDHGCLRRLVDVGDQRHTESSLDVLKNPHAFFEARATVRADR